MHRPPALRGPQPSAPPGPPTRRTSRRTSRRTPGLQPAVGERRGSVGALPPCMCRLAAARRIRAAAGASITPDPAPRPLRARTDALEPLFTAPMTPPGGAAVEKMGGGTWGAALPRSAHPPACPTTLQPAAGLLHTCGTQHCHAHVEVRRASGRHDRAGSPQVAFRNRALRRAFCRCPDLQWLGFSHMFTLGGNQLSRGARPLALREPGAPTAARSAVETSQG